MNQQSLNSPGAPIYGSERLPVKLPERLYGREADLEAIHVMLRAGTAVLLHGPAGFGKTTLAAALAANYAEMPGGVLWIDAADDSLRSLLVRVERAYGIPDPGSGMARQAAVREALDNNRPLVVIDGHVRIDATRDFVRMCAPDLPVIVIHSALESGPWTPHEVKALDGADAAEMMGTLVGAVASEDDLAGLNAALGGHPLSIVVAAHQVALGIVSPDEFVERMPDMPPGAVNRAMGVLMAAYRLLSSTQQGMLLLLGTTLASGASEDLLAEMAGAPESVVRPALRQLLVRRLVNDRAVYGRPHFAAHELVHVFAEAFLRSKDQYESMIERHLDGLLAYLRRHMADGDLDALAAEMPTALRAGAVAARTGRTAYLSQLIQLLEPSESQDFVVARGFGAELEWLWQLQEDPAWISAGALALPDEDAIEIEPLPGEGADWAEETAPEVEMVEVVPEELTSEAEESFAALAEALDVEEVTQAPEPPALPPEPATLPEAAGIPDMLPESAPRLGPALGQRAQEAALSGDTAQAIAQYMAALEEYRANNEVEDELAALEALAALSLEQEHYNDVLDYVDQGMTLAKEADNPLREGKLLVVLGDLQAMLGRDDGAETAYKEAISAFRPAEAWLEIGLTLDKLAMLYQDQGRTQDAAALWEQTLPIFERVQDPDDYRAALEKAGDSYAELMEWEKAQIYHTRLLALCREAGDEQAEFDELSRLGYLMEMSGEPDQAVRYYRQALHLALRLGDDEQLGQTYLANARLLVDDTTQLKRVLQLLEAAESIMPGDSEVQRLYRRARTRRQRLTEAGVTLPELVTTLAEFAREAYEQG